MIGDIVFGLLAGLLLGGLHLLWLWRASRRLLSAPAPGAGHGLILIGGAFLRLGVMIGGLALAARYAADPGPALLAALAGLVIARGVALRAARAARADGARRTRAV
jgi:F1F0 ATPase subunit 2